ncbi:hypothetical protein [Candidatus Nitrosocosmicus franklandus]|uniref:DUF2334 domain-containing protein n=1 Tax=Candidatus Nitrosocosmicus franklandianus TaxID=1798806 RepID=A0A484I9N4_9ARCH|nr:hypothetical protein [Candidatus Nitrosocosmicus franklandus]VFJ13463.1 conserved protein of unknown function [Candidatus Nitrosocosmicus franklandus]
MNITPLLGPNGKIPILIRDDDTNFFTKSSMLESIYSQAWNSQFKVGLSVIPYQKTINDVCVPPDVRNCQKHSSIENNEELCRFLKEKIKCNKIEIIQHGVTHDLIDGRGEFSYKIEEKKEEFVNRAIRETFTNYYNSLNTRENEKHINMGFESYVNIGRHIIRKSLDIDPILFVPPFDDCSIQNLKKLTNLGMIPIYGQSNYHRFFRSAYVPNYFKKYFAKKLLEKFAKKGFIIPLIMSNADYCYTECNQGIMLYIPRRLKINPISNSQINANKDKVTPQSFVKWISNTIDYSVVKRTPICILNHYHHYFYDWNHDSSTRKNLFEQWNQILHLLNKMPFSWNTTFLDLYQRIRKIKKINVAITGHKITIQSPDETIDEMSFKVDKALQPAKGKNVINDEQDKTIFTVSQLNPNSEFVFYLK